MGVRCRGAYPSEPVISTPILSRIFFATGPAIPLLASKLLPRDGQPSKPPYQYSADGFRYLDKVVAWGERYKLGIIWDMHGAPGGQNAENISDSDGVARLWTEKQGGRGIGLANGKDPGTVRFPCRLHDHQHGISNERDVAVVR